MTRSHAPARRAVIFLIQCYRSFVSPMRLPSCRFTPTCSQYAMDAVDEYGVQRGGWLACLRLVKCGPWHEGGWDPIPQRPNAVHHGGAPDQPVPHEDALNDAWGNPSNRGEHTTCV